VLVTKDTYASVNHVAAAYVGCAKIAGFLCYAVLTRSAVQEWKESGGH